MLLKWDARPFVVRHLLEPFEQPLALRYAVQIGIGDGILRLHPLGGLCAGVVFEPTVGVGHLGAEILVYGVVARCGGIVDVLCWHNGC